MSKIRTFFAIEIPDTIILKLKQIQDKIKAHDFSIKWVKPENIHLTIRFLGDIESSDVEHIGDLAENVVKSFESVSICAKGIGAFPNLRRPRVVWAGLAGQIDILQQLKENFDSAFETAGIPREGIKFKGHLTLGRIKKNFDTRKFSEVIQEHQEFKSESFKSDSIVFYKSDLKPTGPVYTKIKRFSFRK